jgi:hypothetical protein
MSFPQLELVVKYKVESVCVRTPDGEVLKVEEAEVKAAPAVHAPPPSVESLSPASIEIGEKLNPPEEKQLAIIAHHYSDQGLSKHEIGKKMNIPWQRVQALLKKRWVVAEEPRKTNNKRTLIRFPKIERDGRGVVMTPAIAAVAQRLIDERGMSVAAVCEKVGCSRETLKRGLEE